MSPTFHRAFDRGIIALSDDYRVLVHSKLKDYSPTAGIWQYEQKELLLSQLSGILAFDEEFAGAQEEV